MLEHVVASRERLQTVGVRAYDELLVASSIVRSKMAFKIGLESERRVGTSRNCASKVTVMLAILMRPEYVSM